MPNPAYHTLIYTPCTQLVAFSTLWKVFTLSTVEYSIRHTLESLENNLDVLHWSFYKANYTPNTGHFAQLSIRRTLVIFYNNVLILFLKLFCDRECLMTREDFRLKIGLFLRPKITRFDQLALIFWNRLSQNGINCTQLKIGKDLMSISVSKQLSKSRDFLAGQSLILTRLTKGF